MKTTSRIRRSNAEWAALMAEFDVSGLPATQFCQQRGIAYGTFVRRRRRAEPITEPAEPHAAEWLPIDIRSDGDCGDSAASDRKTDTSGWDIELSLPGGVQLRMRTRA
jgi:hypothetical protein